jgi:hydroxyacylglutathione hydrolase
MVHLDVELVPAFRDNYIYLLTVADSNDVGIVDAGDAAPALAALEGLGLTLTHIFNTHHHADHMGGNAALKARFPQATLIAPKSEALRIADIDLPVAEGDIVAFGGLSFTVLEVPGHTTGHIAFWSRDGRALFCGDTLFSLGCGRMFEGTAEQMWHSLSRLRALPPETRVYCGHEYTENNARFAVTVDPQNVALLERAREVRLLRLEGHPTIPPTLRLENLTNPFLRADNPILAREIGMEGADPVAVFAEMRRRKDVF